jgi:hypothetical protein
MNAQTPVAEQERPRPQKNLPAIVAGGNVRAIVPQDFDGAWRIATAVHASGMAPYGINSPEKAMVAIMHGLEIGLTPMNALQSIAVINGKPTIYGDAALALVRASGLMEAFKEIIEGEGENMKAICRVKRKDEEPIEGEFSVADAKTAGLWTKRGRNGESTPWQTYPKRMLKFRARAFALRDAFADVLKGISIREEVEDYTHAIETNEEPPDPPPVERESPPVVPSDVIEGEVVERTVEAATVADVKQETAPEPEPQEELTLASLYEDSAPAGKTVVWEDTAADDDNPPDPSGTAPVAKAPVAQAAAVAAPVSDPLDVPADLDQRGRTPQTDRMKSSLLRDLVGLDMPSDYVNWMDSARFDIATLPGADEHEVKKNFNSRLKSKLIGQIKLLEDADGFQGWASDARDAINLLPTTDQAEVRSAFSRKQDDVFDAGQ